MRARLSGSKVRVLRNRVSQNVRISCVVLQFGLKFDSHGISSRYLSTGRGNEQLRVDGSRSGGRDSRFVNREEVDKFSSVGDEWWNASSTKGTILLGHRGCLKLLLSPPFCLNFSCFVGAISAHYYCLDCCKSFCLPILYYSFAVLRACSAGKRPLAHFVSTAAFSLPPWLSSRHRPPFFHATYNISCIFIYRHRSVTCDESRSHTLHLRQTGLQFEHHRASRERYTY